MQREPNRTKSKVIHVGTVELEKGAKVLDINDIDTVLLSALNLQANERPTA